jgi:hypothetical protein
VCRFEGNSGHISSHVPDDPSYFGCSDTVFADDQTEGSAHSAPTFCRVVRGVPPNRAHLQLDRLAEVMAQYGLANV